ncbi:MAG TPA: nuclear transport factor 2 family protein [Gemmatimonadaceae bacterium]|nr:nuclear transport factor 2 family protein [Gemmatimonadaceae bacterium]
MRIVRALVVGFILLSASAANAQARPSTASIRKAVFALEEEWTRALIKVDTAAFKRITVPEFVYTEDNVMMNRRELLHAIVTGDKVDWSANEGMQLHDHFPAAIVTGILITKGRNKTGAYTNRYRFTDTWLYRDGKWRAIAAQDYLIPAKK